MKQHEVPVINLMLDLVVANAKDVAKEHEAFVLRAMKSAKRSLALCNKAERERLEREARDRAPFRLDARARLVP